MKLTTNIDGKVEDIIWVDKKITAPLPEFAMSTERTASGSYGRSIFNRLKGNGYTISHIDYSTIKDVFVTFESNNPFLGIQLQYRRNIVLKMKGIGSINLRESHFHLSYVPEIFCSAFLEKELKYETFNIHFSAFFLRDFLSLFPPLQDLLLNVQERKAYMLCNSPFYSSTDIRMIVSDIIKSKFSGEIKRILTDLKVMELLVLIINQLKQNSELTDLSLSNTDKENVYKASTLIASNVKSPKTIKELARDCGINENKLKKGFKRLYGRTVFEYVTELRMEKGHSLLVTSEASVTNIAYECGYKNVSNFSTAFKRYFGYSPAFLRKR